MRKIKFEIVDEEPEPTPIVNIVKCWLDVREDALRLMISNNEGGTNEILKITANGVQLCKFVQHELGIALDYPLTGPTIKFINKPYSVGH
jgi:hypothetical protein